MPEARLIIATRWAPVNEFVEYVVDPNQDIISLQQVSSAFLLLFVFSAYGGIRTGLGHLGKGCIVRDTTARRLPY